MFKKIIITFLSLFLLLGSVKPLTAIFESNNKEFSQNFSDSQLNKCCKEMEDEKLANNFSAKPLFIISHIIEYSYDISATENFITIPTPPPSKIS